MSEKMSHITTKGDELKALYTEVSSRDVGEDIPGWKGRDIAKMDQMDHIRGEQLEVIEVARDALASEFHEDWRKTRVQEDGTYEPRIKSTKDAEWISLHSSDEVDIANTSYEDLPSDWQAENKEAAEVVVGLMVDRDGTVDLANQDTRNEVGGVIHNAWLERNEWAKGGALDVPFDQLPAAEQAKDLSQVEVAQRVFS